MTRRRRLRRRHVAAIVLAIGLLAAGAIWTNVLGVGTRFHDIVQRVERRVSLIIDPPPDRPIADTVLVTPRPVAGDDPSASPADEPSGPPPTLEPGASPTPTPKPPPERVSVDVNLFKHPENHFINEEFDHEWCAVAGTQMVLDMHGKAPLTLAFQKQLASRIGEWESRRDSRNGGWGPSAHGRGARRVRRAGLRGPRLRDPRRRPVRRRQGHREDARARAPAGLARGPHVGDDRVPRGRRPARLRRREDQGHLHQRPVVSDHLLASGAPRTRRARTRTSPRCAATTCPGSGPRATTRTGTGCSSPSCRP